MVFAVFSEISDSTDGRHEGGLFAQPISSEKDAMAVDPKRVEAVFKAVVDAADPFQRTAILDRECGSDKELRQCIEALLEAQREPPTLLDQASANPLEFAPPSQEVTIPFADSADQKAPSATPLEEDSLAQQEAMREYEEPLTLDFLALFL